MTETLTSPAAAGGLLAELQGLLGGEPGFSLDGLSDEELLVYAETVLAAEESRVEPGYRPLPERIAALAAASPERPALVDGGVALTYGELDRRAERLAAELRAAGAGPDRRVAICATRSSRLVVAILATLKAGAAFLCLDPRHPAERLRLILDDAGAHLALHEEEVADRLPPFAGRRLALGEEAAAGDAGPPAARRSPAHPQSLAYLIYTSGSTGRPKGVMVSHRSLSHYLDALGPTLGIRKDDVYLHTATFSFSSSVRQLALPLAHGAAVALARSDEVADPARLMRRVKRDRVTVMDLVPSYWRNLIHALEALPAGERRSLLDNRLRLVVSASEPLLTDVPLAWSRLHPGSRLVNMFGQTETTGIVSCRELAEPEPGAVRITALGGPIPRTAIHVLDESLDLAPLGLPGEVCIAGYGLARGYLGQPRETAARFVPDPFAEAPGGRLYRTGDLARLLPHGHLEFLGRSDHQVKVRGFRIELGAVEAALHDHPGVRAAAVRTVAGPGGGWQLLACYVPASGNGAGADAAELRRHLQERLPEYMVPSGFVAMDALPLTATGKVDRRSLPDRLPEHDAPASTAGRDAGDGLQARLAAVWCQVLERSAVGPTDNFFDLGGDSLLAVRVAARARRDGLAVSPRDLLQHQTLTELAAAVRDRGAAVAGDGPVHGEVPLSVGQSWFLSYEPVVPDHYNHPYYVELTERVPAAVVAAAVDRLAADHDMLRLRCRQDDEGVWQQRVAEREEHRLVSALDLSGLGTAAQERAMAAAAVRLQRSLDLARGPVVRGLHYRLGSERPDRLLLVVHHMATDGVSQHVLMEDLERACRRLAAGEDLPPAPRSTSFQELNRRLEEQAHSAQVRREIAYWAAPERRSVQPLPRDLPGPEAPFASTGQVLRWLDPELTAAVVAPPGPDGASAEAILLAALVRAFARWTGRPSLLVDLVAHGRDPDLPGVDLSRTVGWVSYSYPVLLSLEEGSPASGWPGQIAAQLAAVPGNGSGFGQLRYLHRDPQVARRMASLPRPEVDFSYLGRFGEQVPDDALLLRGVQGPVGRAICGRNPRHHLMDVFLRRVDDRIRVDWRYSDRLHRRSTAETLADDYVRSLGAMLAPAATAFANQD